MAVKPVTTTVQLSRAIDCDGRTVDQVVISGEPGGTTLPVNESDGHYLVDGLEVAALVARRTGLSRPALDKLTPLDLQTIVLTLFQQRMPRKTKR